MALHDYLAGEVAEDWADGLITRREALRRLSLLGLTVSSAVALLAACAPGEGAAVTTPPPTRSATPPGSGRVIAGAPITFPGERVELSGFLAPAEQATGAMLVIHENRGLNDHIRGLAGRLAADGYASLAIDLLSEEGGSEALGEGAVQAALSQASDERLVADMRSGLDELARRAPGAALGIVGFCFGGGMVWTLLDAGEPRLAAAIPFYGPAPARPDFSGNGAAVLAVYAELDTRVNASRETARTALETAGLTHEVMTYPGADHGFFNETGARHDPTQAAAAYADVLAWLETHLGG